MGAHQIRRWIDSFLNRGGSKRRAQRPTFRPRLEALEERTLLNAGALVPTFGSGGVVLVNSPGALSLYPYGVQSVFAAQQDGRLVEAAPVTGNGFEVFRQNADGSADATFGSGGAVVISTAGHSLSEVSNASALNQNGLGYAGLTAVAVQADGKILVAGTFSDDTGRSEGPSPSDSPGAVTLPILTEIFINTTFVARLNSDGTVDQTFGNGGISLGAFAPDTSETASGLAEQTDGKIILEGSSGGDYGLARYNTDGSLDSTFGVGGTVVSSVKMGNPYASMALQADGRIIVAGSVYNDDPTQNEIVALRYNSDGSLDTTFGNGGVVETAIGDYESGITDIAVQANGDIVAAGFASEVGGGPEAVLLRYTAAGTLDATFGDGGHVFTGIHPNDYGMDGPLLALQSDGAIVIGTTVPSTGVYDVYAPVDTVLARYDAAGAVDPTFGNDGQVVTTLGQSSAYLFGLAFLPNGHIVTEGVTYDFVPTAGPISNLQLTLASFESGVPPAPPVVTLPIEFQPTPPPPVVVTRPIVIAPPLDPTFGNGGVTVQNSIPIHSQQWVLGVQSDGKLLEAGGGDVYGLQGLQVLRTNADGSLDETFLGSTGSPYYLTGGYFTAGAVVVQADGKIFVAGTVDLDYPFTGAGVEPHHANEFFVARFNSDGSLDDSFGAGGMAVTPFGGELVNVAGVVVQADGKIVVAGSTDAQFTLVRYNPDGSSDATFGNAGVVVTPTFGFQDAANGIALQSDGKIVVVGRLVTSIATSDFGAVRYNTDGSMDATFGNGGIVDTHIVGENSEATQVAVQANGDIVVVGDADADGRTFNAVLVRYTPDGQLDATFGNGGQVFTNISTGFSTRLVLQADGKILLGTSDGLPGTGGGVLLARYDSDGGIDATFGDGGQIITNLGQYSVNLTDLALEPDGTIVAVGMSFTGPLTNPDQIGQLGPFLTLARFLNDSLPLVLIQPPPLAAPPQSPDNSAPSQAPVVPSAPPPVVPNSLVFTPAPSAVVPQTPPSLVAPSFDGQTAIVNTSSTASDPFGIHLVGGSGPGNVDATAKWDDFPLLSPDYILGDAGTGLAALPFTPADEAGVATTTIMDALFQRMPFWTPTEWMPVVETAPLADFPAKGNPIWSPLVKSEAGRWPSLAVGVLLSTGMTAAAVEKRRWDGMKAAMRREQ